MSQLEINDSKEAVGEKLLVPCRLLYSVLPISVANELRHSRPVPAKKYDCVTLLFSGIVGFGAYCAAHTDSSGAMKIVNMLNQLYTAFDVLTDPKKNPNVYKVSICLVEESLLKVFCVQTKYRVVTDRLDDMKQDYKFYKRVFLKFFIILFGNMIGWIIFQYYV